MKDYKSEEFFKKDYKRGRCNPCKYAREIYAQDNWVFLGCDYGNRKGQWVKEIKNCPLGEKK